MRQRILIWAGAAAMIVAAASAQNLIIDPTRPVTGPAPAMTAHNEAICQTHASLRKLQKAIDALKKQPDGPNKAAKTAHLKQDIERYQQELREMKATLEEK